MEGVFEYREGPLEGDPANRGKIQVGVAYVGKRITAMAKEDS